MKFIDLTNEGAITSSNTGRCKLINNTYNLLI